MIIFGPKKVVAPPLVVSKIVTTRNGCPGDFIFLMGKSMKTRYLALEIKNKFFEFELFWRGFNFAHSLSLREKNVLIFAHFGFVREIARKLSRAKINTNKVVYRDGPRCTGPQLGQNSPAVMASPPF